MTSRAVLLLLSVAATACYDSPVAPASPPQGLPVTLRELGAAEGFTSGSPVIAQGDSVMLTAVLGGMGCFDVSTSAGLSNGRLVVTITTRPLGGQTMCSLVARTAPYRAVVRPAPAGRYTALLRQRFESPPQAPQEREVVRATVVVP
jgi:hypothetical protein